MYEHRGQQGLHGIDALTRYLDDQGVSYQVIEHEQTFTALTEADAAGVAPQDVAKTIVLHDDDGYKLAIIAACDQLDMRKVRDAAHASRRLRLATEPEIGAELGPFEVGSTPPFGDMLEAPEIVDRSLLDHERVLCSGGDRRHSVLVNTRDLVRLARPQVAEIRQE